MRPFTLLALALLSTPAWAQATAPPTGATDITRAELAAVLKSLNPDAVTDQQIKVVDVGPYNVAVGILHRSGRATQNAIAHSAITEIYYVLGGAGTFVTGGTMTGASPADPNGNTVRVLVGPSTNGTAVAGGQSRRIGPGDVIIVPPGVAHWFSAVEQDLDYLVFRVDPNHVLPAGYVHQLLK
jgi:quercetin dioxygenase-like cupin family protein